MSLKPGSIVMTVERSVSHDLAVDRIPALIDSLNDVFMPRRLAYALDGDEPTPVASLAFERYGTEPLWRGERATIAPLTHFEHTPDVDLVERLRTALEMRSASSLRFTAEGALRHRSSFGSSPEWYGRWRMTEMVLHELVTVRLEWSPELRELEAVFPLSGHPITATRLTAAGEGSKTAMPRSAPCSRP